jgi:hypothetical protein
VLRRLLVLVGLLAVLAAALTALVLRLPWPHTLAAGWRIVIVMCATLLLGPVIIQAWRRPLEVVSILTTTVAALVTVLLAAITSDLARTTAQQSQSATAIARELALARAQQHQPHVYAWLEPGLEEGQFMLTVKNLGSGVAKDITVKLDAQGRGFSRAYPLLGPGQEITNLLGELPTRSRLANVAVTCLDASEDTLGWRYVQDLTSATAPSSRFAETRDQVTRERRRQQALDQEARHLSAMLERLAQPLAAPGAPAPPDS